MQRPTVDGNAGDDQLKTSTTANLLPNPKSDTTVDLIQQTGPRKPWPNGSLSPPTPDT